MNQSMAAKRKIPRPRFKGFIAIEPQAQQSQVTTLLSVSNEASATLRKIGVRWVIKQQWVRGNNEWVRITNSFQALPILMGDERSIKMFPDEIWKSSLLSDCFRFG